MFYMVMGLKGKERIVKHRPEIYIYLLNFIGSRQSDFAVPGLSFSL